MTYIVNDNCIKCKYMDCVEVCPVDCFYEGENMLVIHPDECIDCADRAKTAGIRGEAQGEERAVRESERLGRIGRLTRPKSRPGRQCAQIEPRDPPQAATAAVMASTPRMLSARRKL